MTRTPTTVRQLDLSTLKAVREVVTKALQNQVCTWEQDAADAAARGEYRSAQQFKDWAFAADLVIHSTSMAVGTLILETLDSLSLVEDSRTVQLPEVQRSADDRYLNALTAEGTSQQPAP